MELSVLPARRPELDPAPSEGRCLAGTNPPLRLFEVPVPANLRRFGESIRASALGDPKRPSIVVLGGISADCYPGIRPDGSTGWWPGLVGQNGAIDPERHYIIGVEFAADDTGSTAPTTFDQAQVLAAALDVIGIDQPCTIVGASYGGMVALALAEREPERIAQLIIVSAGAEPHPAATAARELQRRVVALGIECGRGGQALAIARGMAMLTYRTPAEFERRFDGGIDDFRPEVSSAPGAYLRARGEAFLSVMSPGRFLSLSASIDRHRVNPAAITAPCLLIGAESDQLVNPDQMRGLSRALSGTCELHLLDSLFGHDMFLKESERIGGIVATVLGSRQ
ncbi:MAG: alpha/beta fold hydrolase [Pseudomonadota bacterium]|nr:alpha/beta fold hydrolase [Pseudomonadota bacterium]